MTEPLDGPSAALQALAARAAALDDDSALQARVRDSLERSFGALDGLTLGSAATPMAGATATSTSAGATVSKALFSKAVAGALFAGAILGASVVELRHRLAGPPLPAAPVDVVEPAPARALAPPVPAVPASAPVEAAPQELPQPAIGEARSARRPLPPRAAPVSTPSEPPPATTQVAPAPPPQALDALDQERLLIERGKTALARRDFAAVQAAVDVHRARHADGAFAEERDALEVIALLRAGDARGPSTADAFSRRYPRSAYLPAIRAAAPALP